MTAPKDTRADGATPTLPQADMSAAETARAGGERANADYEVGEWIEQQRMTLTKAARRALVDLILFARQSAAIDAGGQEVPAHRDYKADFETRARRLLEKARGANPLDGQAIMARDLERLCMAYLEASHPEAPPASAPPAAAVAQPVAQWVEAYGKYLAAVDAYNTRLKGIRERETKFPREFGNDNPHAEFKAVETTKQAALALLQPMHAALAASPIAPQAGQAGEEKGRG